MTCQYYHHKNCARPNLGHQNGPPNPYHPSFLSKNLWRPYTPTPHRDRQILPLMSIPTRPPHPIPSAPHPLQPFHPHHPRQAPHYHHPHKLTYSHHPLPSHHPQPGFRPHHPLPRFQSHLPLLGFRSPATFPEMATHLNQQMTYHPHRH